MLLAIHVLMSVIAYHYIYIYILQVRLIYRTGYAQGLPLGRAAHNRNSCNRLDCFVLVEQLAMILMVLLLLLLLLVGFYAGIMSARLSAAKRAEPTTRRKFYRFN